MLSISPVKSFFENIYKEFYSYIRKKKVLTSTIGPLENANGEKITDETEMSKSLNTFFASVFTLEDQDNIPYATPIQEENATIFTLQKNKS